MTLVLNMGTKPRGLEIKTFGNLTPSLSDKVFLGDYEISVEDFLAAAAYVLSNTPLKEDDPRRKFVEAVKASRETDQGYDNHFVIPGFEFF